MRGEWQSVGTAHNLKRMHTLTLKQRRRDEDGKLLALRNREWKREHGQGAKRDRAWFLREIAPKLDAFSLAEIAAATGLSLAACSRFRVGVRAPHPRHWPAFAALVSEGNASRAHLTCTPMHRQRGKRPLLRRMRAAAMLNDPTPSEPHLYDSLEECDPTPSVSQSPDASSYLATATPMGPLPAAKGEPGTGVSAPVVALMV